MKITPTIITIILLMSCNFETKEQREKRKEEEVCSLAYKYISECAYEIKRVRVAPLQSCTKKYAEKVLMHSCKELVSTLE